MTQITIQADLGGFQIAFVEELSGAIRQESLNEQLDRFTKAIGRQRSKLTLSEKLVDLLASKKALETFDERYNEAIRQKAEERARINLSFRQPEGRRLEHKSDRQLAAEKQNDEEVEQLHKDWGKERRTLLAHIPILEAQISRLRAVIAGRDPNEPLDLHNAQLDMQLGLAGIEVQGAAD